MVVSLCLLNREKLPRFVGKFVSYPGRPSDFSQSDQATLRRSGPGVLDLAQAMAAMAAMGVWLLDPMVESSKPVEAWKPIMAPL